MKDIVLSVGSGKLIENDGGKVFFYLTKDYLVRVSFDQVNGIVREYVALEGTDYRGAIEVDLNEVDGLNWKMFDEVILMHMDEADMFYELFAEISLGGF
ncbi:MAG: hypothetical protein HXK00_00205 [Abiotrophia defectiva]|uniref:Uncharacterized protein n=1 Tax=Abiotrophia defectiva TaxID=46125 RepID=A0A929MMP3_ABIDE|nr:hypothetical protein [Abiotrophia defectiva]